MNLNWRNWRFRQPENVFENNMSKITHLTSDGHTHMVDVSDKAVTNRMAKGRFIFRPKFTLKSKRLTGKPPKAQLPKLPELRGLWQQKIPPVLFHFVIR